MRLDASTVGITAGVTAAILFAACALFVGAAPEIATAFFSDVLHLDLAGLLRPLTWGGLAIGVICFALGTGLIFAFTAWVYDRLAGINSRRT